MGRHVQQESGPNINNCGGTYARNDADTHQTLHRRFVAIASLGCCSLLLGLDSALLLSHSIPASLTLHCWQPQIMCLQCKLLRLAVAQVIAGEEIKVRRHGDRTAHCSRVSCRPCVTLKRPFLCRSSPLLRRSVLGGRRTPRLYGLFRQIRVHRRKARPSGSILGSRQENTRVGCALRFGLRLSGQKGSAICGCVSRRLHRR